MCGIRQRLTGCELKIAANGVAANCPGLPGTPLLLTLKSPVSQETPQSQANSADWSPCQEPKVEGNCLSKPGAPHSEGLVLDGTVLELWPK